MGDPLPGPQIGSPPADAGLSFGGDTYEARDGLLEHFTDAMSSFGAGLGRMAEAGLSAGTKAMNAGPRLAVDGHHDAGTGETYELRFHRPVTRDEAERQIFADGHVPAQKNYDGTDPRKGVQFRPVDGHGGKASKWELYMPSAEVGSYGSLKAGLEGMLFGSPAKTPSRVPPATRQVIESGQIPTPDDARFPWVATGYPSPNQQVTAWRDGDTVFRYDGKTGKLEGYQESKRPGMGGFNESMRKYVMVDGLPVDEALRRTQKDFDQYFSDAVLEFAIGSVG